MPSRPFSECSISPCLPEARRASSVGMPIPRLTFMPSPSSWAARRTMHPARVSHLRRPAPERRSRSACHSHDRRRPAGRRSRACGHGLGPAHRRRRAPHLGDRHAPGHRRERVEVPRRPPVYEVSEWVGLPRLHERKVGVQRSLKQVDAPVDLLGRLALGDRCSDSCGGVKGWYPAPAARIRSASVPCGTSSTSSSSERNCCSNVLFPPM